MTVLLGIAVFFGAVAIDYADSMNTRAVASGHAHGAARWSVTMYLVGLVSFYAFIQISWWFALPEAAGLYLGSWLAVKRHPSSVA